MTLNNDPDGTDLAPDDAELSTISNLSVGVPGSAIPSEHSPADQGEAPADLEDRSAPGVPTPSRSGLSADEVERLTHQDAQTVEANNALDRAEGVVPDDED